MSKYTRKEVLETLVDGAVKGVGCALIASSLLTFTVGDSYADKRMTKEQLEESQRKSEQERKKEKKEETEKREEVDIKKPLNEEQRELLNNMYAYAVLKTYDDLETDLIQKSGMAAGFQYGLVKSALRRELAHADISDVLTIKKAWSEDDKLEEYSFKNYVNSKFPTSYKIGNLEVDNTKTELLAMYVASHSKKKKDMMDVLIEAYKTANKSHPVGVEGESAIIKYEDVEKVANKQLKKKEMLTFYGDVNNDKNIRSRDEIMCDIAKRMYWLLEEPGDLWEMQKSRKFLRRNASLKNVDETVAEASELLLDAYGPSFPFYVK